eukprot:363429-Chlamydomonas_euryale.AAC.16
MKRSWTIVLHLWAWCHTCVATPRKTGKEMKAKAGRESESKLQEADLIGCACVKRSKQSKINCKGSA